MSALPSPSPTNSDSRGDLPGQANSPQAARHRRLLLIIAPTLIIVGVLVLAFLQRMPLPTRILVGLTDVFTGLILLVVVRQKFPRNHRS